MKITAKLLRKVIKIGFLFSLLLLMSYCSQNDDECPSESLGALQLLPSTIDSMPYKDGDIIYYKDHLQNEVNYTVHIDDNIHVLIGKYTLTSSSGESESVGGNAYSVPCKNDPSQNIVFNYSYNSSYYYLDDTLNTLGVNLSLFYKLIAFKENGELQQADALTINPIIRIMDKENRGAQQEGGFKFMSNANGNNYRDIIILDQRTLADKHLVDFSQEISEMTFLDKTFYHVHANEDENIYFNKQQGFVAFLDSTDKVWVYDRIESEKSN